MPDEDIDARSEGLNSAMKSLRELQQTIEGHTVDQHEETVYEQEHRNGFDELYTTIITKKKRHTVKKTWVDKKVTSSRQAFLEGLTTGLKNPSGKGKRLIISHIGSEEGFLEEGLMIFEAKKNCEDYHDEMNAVCFEKWFAGVLPKLRPNSIVESEQGDDFSCGDVSIIAWMDSKMVSIISTYHTPETYKNMKDYNGAMKGVDLKEQKLSMYPLERKRCLIWHMKIYKRLMNVSVHNAFVLYRSSMARKDKLAESHLAAIRGFTTIGDETIA
ncbi:hypothetical protein HF086_000191 [Spodoptera exigua]|uniref:PiggyBac transposable element-derived protein domain-containing protein n=1 Tax=Spodoptera exigua TaxID=7107 RepID=A0A922M061_SPOEX|nr:hypothetical protein HF086_000191 [Spodoptera exigua]